MLSNDKNQSSITLALLQQQVFKEIPWLEMIKLDKNLCKYDNFMHTFKLTVDVVNLDITKKKNYCS